jgi:hydrogenase/urease accessory protein HupE
MRALPGAAAVLSSYVRLGVLHISTGPDHLLFVLGLVLLVVGRRRLLWTITAFTVGHSVTLSLASLGLVHIPPAPIEVAIALTLLWVAIELARDRAQPTWSRRFPWALAFVFGLLHGLGFAGALAQVGLPDSEIPLALFGFNVGIEIGQLIFVGAILLVRPLTRDPRLSPVPACAIGTLASFFMLDRLWP